MISIHLLIQNLATDITINIMHILHQCGKVYITRLNTNRWKKHVVANARFILLGVSYITHHIEIFMKTIIH